MADLWLTEVTAADVGGRRILSFKSYPDPKPLTIGTGPLDALCARCSFVLLERADPADVRSSHLLIRCPECGTLNATGQSVLSSDT